MSSHLKAIAHERCADLRRPHRNALSKLLQPSERLILALEVQEAPSSSSAEQNGVGPVVRGASRMLGIVVNDSSGKEEAA